MSSISDDASRRESELLREVCANPYDMAPRLKYADWFEDNLGGINYKAEYASARAELIRTQIKLSHPELSGERDEQLGKVEARLALKKREQELFATFKFPGSEDAVWHCGFPTELMSTTGPFMQCCDAVFSHNPIRSVTLADREPGQFRGKPGEHRGVTWASNLKWFWDFRPGVSGPAVLPRELASSPVWNYAEWNHDCPTYFTKEKAVAALSMALVTHGRRMAGLPDMWVFGPNPRMLERGITLAELQPA